MTSAPGSMGPPGSRGSAGSMGSPGWRGPPAVELLDRAVAYTRGCLAQVPLHDLDRPTPCTQWSLRDLLTHLEDSLAALAEAAQAPVLALAPHRGPTDAALLVASLRERASALVAAWLPTQSHDSRGWPVVRLGDAAVTRETLGLVGALEVTLHGWDVAEASGLAQPVPPALALDLWPVARDFITDEDRPVLFGPPVHLPETAAPAARLLAHAGRAARQW